MNSTDVIDVLSDPFILHGVPGHIRSDNGPGIRCQSGTGLDPCCRRQNRLHRAGQSWEDGYIESFNARMRDELLNGELFYSLKEAQIIVENWRRHYNGIRPIGD